MKEKIDDKKTKKVKARKGNELPKKRINEQSSVGAGSPPVTY